MLTEDGYKVYPDVIRRAADEIDQQRQAWIRQRKLIRVVNTDVAREGQE